MSKPILVPLPEHPAVGFRLLFLITFFMLAPRAGIVFAAPVISSVSGEVVDGSTVTVNGYGFGINKALEGNTIEWLGGASGNIETGVPESVFAKTNWTNAVPSSSFQPAVYSSDKSHSGTKSLKSFWPTTQYASGFSHDTHGLSDGKIYATWWVYYHHVNTNGQWKIWRLNNISSNGTSPQGEIYSNQWFNGDGTLSQNMDLIFCGMPGVNGTRCFLGCNNGIPPTLDSYWGNGNSFINPGKWIRYELYAQESSSAGVRDAVFKTWFHKQDSAVYGFRNWQSFPSRDLSLEYRDGQHSPSSDRIFINGQSSGATAWLTGWVDAATGLTISSTGQLYIDAVTGTFQIGENLMEGTTVLAVVDGLAGDTIAPWRYFHFQNYRGDFTTGDRTLEKIYMDDIFIQTGTQARVELGDAPSWDACSHREIQPPCAWSANSLEFTVNQGTFLNGTTAYLFVVDESGTAGSGYPLSFGGVVSDAAAPYAPDNLTIQ